MDGLIDGEILPDGERLGLLEGEAEGLTLPLGESDGL